MARARSAELTRFLALRAVLALGAAAALVAALDGPAKAQDAAPADDAEAAAMEDDAAAVLCGDPRLVGRLHPPISQPVSEDDPRRCGGEDLVEITAFGDVAVAPSAVLTCAAATATAAWVQDSAAPAARALLGAELVELRHVSAYACRTRGRAADAKLSEHAKANALDVAALRLAGDITVSVLDDWGPAAPEAADDGADADDAADGAAAAAPGGDRRDAEPAATDPKDDEAAEADAASADPADTPAARAAFLRQIWTEACGPFSTVLGPEADAAHRDHFHFDAAERRAPYCL